MHICPLFCSIFFKNTPIEIINIYMRVLSFHFLFLYEKVKISRVEREKSHGNPHTSVEIKKYTYDATWVRNYA